MIRVEAIVKDFDRVRVLDGINLRVERGTVFGLLGPNGAGKTTLINILSCQTPPTAGDASIDGYSILREPARVRESIGLVPQEAALYKKLSVKENIALMGTLQGLKGEALKNSVDHLLSRLGMEGYADRRAGDCSVGMRQALNIAMGLVHSPHVILMDEPTTGLDPQARHSIWELLRELAWEGKTLFITTHNMLEAEQICDRIALLHRGDIRAEGSPEEIKNILGKDQAVIKLGREHHQRLRELAVKLGLELSSLDEERMSISGVKLLEKMPAICVGLPEVELLSLTEISLEDAFMRFLGSGVGQ